MTKSELIAKIAEKYPMLYNSDIEKIVNTVFNTIITSIVSGDRVELRGFATFGLKKLNARKSRNPRTGDSVQVDSKLVPFFRMGKELKERINS